MTSVALTLAGVRLGMRRLAPVSLFAAPFGLAFGAAAAAQGLPPVQVIAMSASVFAGAAQFAALDLWREPLPLLSLALVVLAVNARLIIFGAALSGSVNALPRSQRWLVLAFLTDPNFADTQAAQREGHWDLGILLGGGFALWIAWVAGTVFGVLAGSAMGGTEQFGFDVVMAAFFTAIVVGGFRSRTALLPAAVAAGVAVVALPLLPDGWNILAGALCGALAGVVIHDA